jgi:deoxyribonuclease V
LCRLRKKPRFVAGLDCAFNQSKTTIFAAVVVLKMERGLPSPRCTTAETRQRRQDACAPLKLIETATAALPLVFPYVPGLLSFREIPVCLEAIKKLQTPVDLFLIDGQGIAHPRRLGLASHLGLFLNTPTIGCAKSRLIGIYDEPGKNKGDFSWLYHKDDTIGVVLRTRDNIKPLFISPGHLCTFDDAIHYTLACTTKYRLPEPTRLAHQTVTRHQ